MSSYTPGPWITGQYDPRYVFGEHGKFVCVLKNNSDIIEEDVANARLIAAAPELLEALEIASEIIMANFGVKEPVIESAIAKARGELQ